MDSLKKNGKETCGYRYKSISDDHSFMWTEIMILYAV